MQGNIECRGILNAGEYRMQLMQGNIECKGISNAGEYRMQGNIECRGIIALITNLLTKKVTKMANSNTN